MAKEPTDVSGGSDAPSDVIVTEGDDGSLIYSGRVEPFSQTVHIGMAEETDTAIPLTAVMSAYEASARSVSAPEQQDAIRALESTFSQLEDSVVYAYAFDDEPVGPRISETQVPESTSKALAGYEWERRDKEKLKRETKSARVWSLGEKILLVVVGAVVGALFSWVGLQ